MKISSPRRRRSKRWELGISEFVYKPLTQKELAGVIRNILDSQQKAAAKK